MRHRKIDCDITDLGGTEAEQVARVVVPVSLEQTERQQIEDVLSGFSVTPETVDKLERLLDRIAFTRAGECLRHVVRCLANSPAGRALERTLLGSDGRSLADDAAELGCTRQNLHKHERKAKEKLARLTPGTFVEAEAKTTT